MSKEILLDKLAQGFSEEAAEGVNAVYAFKLGTQSYSLKIEEGKCEILDGITDKPNVTLEASEDTWKEIINGDLAAQMAFITGRLTVDGDFSLALKLPQIFSL